MGYLTGREVHLTNFNLHWTWRNFSSNWRFRYMSVSMARASLNKSWELVTNTTAASKYIPKRPKIFINWNPPFQNWLHNIFKNCFLWSKTYFTAFTFRGTFTKYWHISKSSIWRKNSSSSVKVKIHQMYLFTRQITQNKTL